MAGPNVSIDAVTPARYLSGSSAPCQRNILRSTASRPVYSQMFANVKLSLEIRDLDPVGD